MPLYDFICNTCGKEFEALVMGSDRPYCPNCQSDDLTKQMSTFAFKSAGGGSTGEGSSSSGPSCGGCPGGSCSTCH